MKGQIVLQIGADTIADLNLKKKPTAGMRVNLRRHESQSSKNFQTISISFPNAHLCNPRMD